MPITRFGDANAPRWMSPALEKVAIPVRVAVGLFAVGAIVFGAWQSFQSGVGVRIVGLSVGLAVGALVIVAALYFWLRYWRPVKDAVKQVSLANPASVVIGGRIPRLTRDVSENVWPDAVGPIPEPQPIVVISDGTGIKLLSAAQFPQIIGHCGWQTILDVRPVEYVEGGRAYEGLAVLGPIPSRAVVLQVVVRGRVSVSFPRGRALQGVANRLLSQRPSASGPLQQD